MTHHQQKQLRAMSVLFRLILLASFTKSHGQAAVEAEPTNQVVIRLQSWSNTPQAVAANVKQVGF